MEGALKDIFSCGKIISGEGDNIKCGYLVKTRDKWVNQVDRCRAMSYTPDPSKPKEKIKTGDLVSIHTQEIGSVYSYFFWYGFVFRVRNASHF